MGSHRAWHRTGNQLERKKHTVISPSVKFETGFLNKLTDGELLILNQEIVAEIKARRAERVANQRARLYTGQLATFNDRLGRAVTARIDKVNRKNVKLTEPTGRRWTVAISLLSPVSED